MSAQTQVSGKKQQGTWSARGSKLRLQNEKLRLNLDIDLQTQYSNFKNVLQQIAQKIGDIEQEAEEHKYVQYLSFRIVPPRAGARHLTQIVDPAITWPTELHDNEHTVLTASHPYRLVLETLEPLPEDRKCFRLINGVLVERTVKDIVPALQTNQDGLKKVLDDLVKNYKTKQDELDSWKVSQTF